MAYREAGLTAAFAGPSIYVNGREVGKLYPRSCVEVAVEPGDYEIKSEGNFFNWPGPPRIMTISLSPESTRYLQLVVLAGGGPAIVNHTYAERSEAEVRKVLETIGECTKG